MVHKRRKTSSSRTPKERIYVRTKPYEDPDAEKEETKPSIVISIPSIDVHMMKEGTDLVIKSGGAEVGRMDARPLAAGVKSAAARLLPKFIKNPMVSKLVEQFLK